MNDYSGIGGKFPNFISMNLENIHIIGTTCASDAIEGSFSFKYPLSIKTKAIATAEEEASGVNETGSIRRNAAKTHPGARKTGN